MKEALGGLGALEGFRFEPKRLSSSPSSVVRRPSTLHAIVSPSGIRGACGYMYSYTHAMLHTARGAYMVEKKCESSQRPSS